MSIAIALFLIGAGVLTLGSLIDSASRVPGLLAGLEADRQRLADVTPYTGPTYTRHDRETEGN